MSIGKDRDEVEEEMPSEQQAAEVLGFDSLDGGESPQIEEKEDGGLPSRAELWEVVKSQAETIGELTNEIERLEDRVGDLESEAEKASKLRTDFAGDLHDLSETGEEAKEIAKTAIRKVEQGIAANESEDTGGETDGQTQPNGINLPGDVTQSSSPLDFFANCRDHNVKKRFVEDRNRKNKYRAIRISLRWQEFGTVRNDGSGVFWTRDDMEQALTAILGNVPHPTTVTRVWEEMDKIGSSDIEENTRKISPSHPKTELLEMDMETAEGLLDNRYVHLDLLDDSSINPGTVTPVVTGEQPSGA